MRCLQYKTLFLLLFCQCATLSVIAQWQPAPNYPKGYFRNPLSIPISLAGNFGELRPNHFHMGLDLKTNARENLPVYAAAGGYISKVKIEPSGFGRAIYIQHPNGFTTLYAHLNDFYPALENWVKQQQYALLSWKVELTLPPQQFPVTAGQLIAYSGNTGGSQGPHVHFEIRRSSDDACVNPQLFGFAIPDNTTPIINRWSIFNRTTSTYQSAPEIISVNGSGGNYSSALQLVSWPLVSLGIGAWDTHTGSSNLNGIFSAELWVDDQPRSYFSMDGIGYEATRYLNWHIDYRTKMSGGPYLQHLSELPGLLLPMYQELNGGGVIDLSDKQIHHIKIIVKDASGNTSTLQSKLQYNGATGTASTKRMLRPLLLEVIEENNFECYLSETTLYDSVAYSYQMREATSAAVVSQQHQLLSHLVPAQDSFLVRIKPTRTLTADQQQRIVLQRISGSKKDVKKVNWSQGMAQAYVRDFGIYQLVLDQVPPTLTASFSNGANLSTASRIVFTAGDNNEKWKNFSAQLDGSWLRFTNDKNRNFIYRFDEKCPPGNHQLTVSLEDEAGNRIEHTYRFTR